MFGKRISIPKEMLARIKEAVDVAGYSSVEEFVSNALEKELERIVISTTESCDEETVRKRLQGLGYID